MYAGLLPAVQENLTKFKRYFTFIDTNFRIFQPLNCIEVFKTLNHYIFKENNCAIRLSIGPPPKVIETTNDIISKWQRKYTQKR